MPKVTPANPETLISGSGRRKTRIIGVCAALGLHVLVLVLFVIATPKPELMPDLAPTLDLELWRMPEHAREPSHTLARTRSRPTATTTGAPVRQHIPSPSPLPLPLNKPNTGPVAANGYSRAGDGGFGRWAVRGESGGSLSEGLRHPRRCFGLDVPPEGRPKDCPEWAVNGNAPPAPDPDRDHWRRDIRAIDRHLWYRDKVQCVDPNGSGVTALNSHRGDRVRFRTGCRGDQDARDEVDFKNGQTVDTKNVPDYGS